MKDRLIIVRGGGDLATGVVQSLYQAGFQVLILETARPSAIRRQVSLCEAVYDGKAVVEHLTCRRCDSIDDLPDVWACQEIPLLVDPGGQAIQVLRPWAVVDAILAKKNLGTNRAMAGHTVALGPGFTAGRDVDAVIETQRGHQLGRIIREGAAMPNTGIPGIIAGYGKERVIHSESSGYVYGLVGIGDSVKKGQPMAVLTKNLLPADTKARAEMGLPVLASLTGIVRGLIRDGYYAPKGFKIADIDPRESEYSNCFTISDKARSLGGAVLTALLWLGRDDLF
ncbi:selenium-dependent molybdenum cofactor biosynthesis protein YqeB [uncultured Megasphaera sp.]|uniref:selenium-dependent molybdenum cofactor biosynthesis protein YqeB n=1 Tax=uncultured Megasphaera sp. TaxID=165188 RepID=UPI0025EDED07|nr:selenium-dependent molybdenum cofactor biosynthesis protein YqeB [uncultured Megasphaera sp.]